MSKKTYRGINLFLLSATKYVSPFWLTFKQANELGGTVRQGERGELIVFWKVDDQVAGGRTDDEPGKAEADEPRRRRFILRYFRVWNLEQCDLPRVVLDKVPKIETYSHDPIEAAERIIHEMPNPLAIQYGGSKAFYSPLTDRITLPSPELFSSAEELNATKFHEIIHAVGSPNAAQPQVDRRTRAVRLAHICRRRTHRRDGSGVSVR